MNVQYAVGDGDLLYVIEANPRASRTVPFVSKATGVPLAKVACRLMLGEKLADMDLPLGQVPRHVSVKEACCRSTASPGRLAAGPRDEVHGRGDGHRERLSRPRSARRRRPRAPRCRCRARCSSRHRLRQAGGHAAGRGLHDLGFRILATGGTAQAIRRMGVPVERISKIFEGSPERGGPHRGR